jgi:hypothetical protein
VLDQNGISVRGQIARVLPADTAFQTVRTTDNFDVPCVFTMAASAVTLGARSPRG